MSLNSVSRLESWQPGTTTDVVTLVTLSVGLRHSPCVHYATLHRVSLNNILRPPASSLTRSLQHNIKTDSRYSGSRSVNLPRKMYKRYLPRHYSEDSDSGEERRRTSRSPNPKQQQQQRLNPAQPVLVLYYTLILRIMARNRIDTCCLQYTVLYLNLN